MSIEVRDPWNLRRSLAEQLGGEIGENRRREHRGLVAYMAWQAIMHNRLLVAATGPFTAKPVKIFGDQTNVALVENPRR
jgi:hypothetical protein